MRVSLVLRAATIGLVVVAISGLPGCGSTFQEVDVGKPSAPGREAFEFDESRLPIGTAYHYIKSNTDGSHAERVSIYLADKTTLESFKWKEPKTSSAGHVRATLDWDRFSATKLESYQMTKTGERHVATAEYEPATRSWAIEIGDLPRQSIRIAQLPFHVYSFDLASLNVTFRFLKNPKASFAVGMTNPTYAEKGPVFEYRGEATFTFLGEEQRELTPCLKYKIEGEGMKNRRGYVWIDRDERHIVDWEMPLPNHPDWTTLKLKLASKEKIKLEEWKSFMKAHVDG